MSSACRGTGVILPVPSGSAIEMWSVLNAWANVGSEVRTPNVAMSSARPIKSSSAPGAPMSTAPLFHQVLREGATRLNDGVRSLGRVYVAVGIDRHAFTRRTLVHAIFAIEGRDERHDAILVHRSDAHAVVPVRMVQRTRL